jgi:spore maturation protein CgeB
MPKENKQIKILYLGDECSSSTSRQRADALIRLGCDVLVVDPRKLIGPRNRLQSFLDYHSGYRFVQARLLDGIQASKSILSFKPNLVWVNGGEMVGERVIRWLKNKYKCELLLYNNDDPTGFRDFNRFATLRRSLHLYSLSAFCRTETALEALALGAKRAIRVMMSYDMHEHTVISNSFSSDMRPLVSFVGTYIPGEHRDKFLLELQNAGLSLSILGNSWTKSRYWNKLQKSFQGRAVYGDSYAQALFSAAISLGFLSHQNRDLLTTRSFEIPSCRGLLCAERTSEHQLLFEDGYEALLWSSSDECISHCKRYIARRSHNITIRRRGYEHVNRLGVSNDDVCTKILNAI